MKKWYNRETVCLNPMNKKREVLKSSLIQGFGTLIVREFFLKLLSFIGQIFLARLLIPSDFGVYVIIAFIINTLSLFTDVGLSLAIIQKHKNLTERELSGIFILKLSLAVFMIVLIWIFAPVLVLLYPTFSEMNILMVKIFSLTFLATSFRMIPVALLERKIKYNIISLVDILGVVIFYIISLVFAYMHFGAWSLIWGVIAKETIETLVLYFVQPFFPKFVFSKDAIKNLVRFGIYLQGTSVVNVINSSIIPVIGGRTGTPYSVGLLDFAYNIASIPETIAVNFGRVAFAGYARIQKEKELLFKSICKSMSLLAILLYLFPVIIFGLGEEIIPLVFSVKWEPAIPAMYWYSAGIIFLPIISSMGQGILVIGKSREIFLTSMITAIIGWFGAFVLVYFWGFVGIAMAYFFITVSFSIFYTIIFRRAQYAFPVISIIVPKLLALLLSYLLLLILNTILPETLLFLIIKLVIGTATYILLLLLFVRKDTIDFFKIISHWLHPKLL